MDRDYDQLRRRAEEILSQKGERSDFDSKELKALLHELEVHQIELELQNEHLLDMQKSLEETKNQFVNLYEFAPVPLITLDRSGIVRGANLRSSIMLEIDKSHLINQPFILFTHKNHHSRFFAMLQSMFEDNTYHMVVLKIKRKEGSWLECRLSGLRDNDNTCRIAITDISDLYETQTELERSKEKYRGLFDNAQVGIIRLDLSTGDLLEANTRCVGILGGDSLKGFREHFRGSDELYPFKNRLLNHFRQYNRIDRERMMVSRDGRDVWIEFSGKLSVQHLYADIVIQDITRQMVVEQSLRVNREKLRRLVDNITDLVSELDTEGRFTYLNRQYSDLLGYSMESLIGSNLTGIVYPEDAEKLLSLLQGFDQERRIRRGDFRLVAGDGRIIWFECIFSMYENSPGVNRIVMISRDISHRIEKETILQESEHKLRNIIRNMPVMLDAFDSKNRILEWNRECERVTGYTREEILSHEDPMVCLYPDDEKRNRMYQEMSDMNWTFRNAEYEMVAKDGTPRVVSWSNQSREYPVPGWFVWAVGVDVTQRVIAERNLRESNRRMSLLNRLARLFLQPLEMGKLVVAILEILNESDHGHQLGLVRQNKVLIYRIDRNEDVIQTCVEYRNTAIDRNQNFLKIDVQKIMDSSVEGLTVPVIFRYPLDTGTECLGFLDMIPTGDDQVSNTCMAFEREVADLLSVGFSRVRLLEQTGSDAIKLETLLHEVNHRVKNNLSSIIGLLYMTLRFHEDDPTIESLISNIIQHIRGFSSVHQLLSVRNWEPIPLSSFVPEIVHSAIRGMNYARRIESDIDCCDTLLDPKPLHTLSLILNELTLNSCKYAGNDNEIIQITVAGCIEKEFVRIEYRDNGPGYPGHVLDGENHGVGIFLIKNLVQNELGGNIEIRNDSGASATILFPYEVVEGLDQDGMNGTE